MSVNRIAMLSTAGAVLAAMIAGATTSGVRRPAPVVIPPNTTAIELQGAELAAEVARLRARLRPTDPPQEPARNLFQFDSRAVRSSPAAADLAPIPLPIAAAPPPPPLTLIGFAAEGAIRTAIISGFGDLFLVKEGDRIGAQYRVSRVDADGVEVTNVSDDTTFTIRLQQ
jgi:hypothetical protein